MPRVDLDVPFAEKDQAKKLGAKWDAIHKVWFVPDGTEAAPFQKWLPMAETDMPEAVVFRQNAEGDMSARIDDLEVGFYHDDGCYVVIWGTETGVPCQYADSVCPEDKDRTWKHCSIADNCPHELTEPIEESSTVMLDEGSRLELEAKIRDMFGKNHDGIGHRQNWPQPAALIFSARPWKFMMDAD
ncbi:MAG: DUF5710 domain-containing protein [Alphaproteobacteria bacterium]